MAGVCYKPTSVALSEVSELDQLVQEFKLSKLAQSCSSQEGAYSNCWKISTAFAELLKTNGYEPALLQLSDLLFECYQAHPAYETEMGLGKVAFQHSVCHVEGLVFDWSFRQFDPEAAWPLIYLSPSELAADWAEIELVQEAS